MKLSLRIALLAILLSLFVCGLSAQTINGSLTGTVYDASGAVVPNAAIVVRSLDTGITRETNADGKGSWRVAALQPGRYALEVTVTGFEKLIQNPILVEAAVERAVDVRLNPGQTSEIVNVTAEAPLIEATRAQISRGVDAKRILDLPGLNTLNGLALLQAGAVPNQNGRPGSGFSINGARTRSNNFMIDGANNNDQSLGVPRQSVAPEALGEFRIITNNFSAEYGRNSGSIVQQNTRSGTNEIHGILRWTWLGNGLDALTTNQQRTFSAQKAAGRSDYLALRAARGVQVRNQLLASAGGPIIRNRTFVFAAYDTDRLRSSQVPITDTITQAGFDLLAANQGFFAPGALQYLRNTYPVANDLTPRGNLSVALPDNRTITIPIAQFNRATANGGALSYGRNIHRGIMKVDHKLSSKDDIWARFLIDDELDPGTVAPLAVNQQGSVTRNYNFTTQHVRTWTSTLLSETRFSYGRREAGFPENFPAQFSIGGLPTIGNQNFPQGRVDNVFEGTNNWTWIKGSHSLRFGGNILLYKLNSQFAPALRGVIQYNSLADLLFDRQATFSQYAGESRVPADTYEYQFFLGDDWRVNNSLTVNLGVRYEYTTTPFGFFSNASPDINNWAPRVGFAWSPKYADGFLGKIFGNGKTAIRGGYSISYDQVFQNILLNTARNYPRGVTVALGNLNNARLWDASARPSVTSPSQFTGNPNTLPVRLFSPDKRIEQPYGQQFSLGVERQITGNNVLKVFYVGTRGINLIREVEQNIGFFAAAINANPGLYAGILPTLQPTTSGGQAAFRRDPSRGSIAVGDGYGMSTYHSLQVTWERRFARNLVFDANYTWSTFINDTDDILGGQANRTYPSVPFNWRLDRGRSGFDQPHRFVTNWAYTSPFFSSQRGIVGRALGGWSLNGIATFAQGVPYSILNNNNPLGILPAQVATATNSQRALYNPNGVLNTGTSATQTNPMWIAANNNTAVIGSGANIRRVGDTYNVDSAVVKSIKTFENQNFEFRWEVFNVFNRRNFAIIPNNTVSAATNNTTFMNLGFTNVAGRSMLFTLRYIF